MVCFSRWATGTLLKGADRRMVMRRHEEYDEELSFFNRPATLGRVLCIPIIILIVIALVRLINMM
jgi:hypothetical protein